MNTSLGRSFRGLPTLLTLAGIVAHAAAAHAQPAYKVRELNPTFNAANAYPGYFVDLNGVALFTAISPAGRELWRSDGTAAGTLMVKDVFPGSTSSETNYLTRVGDVVYFQAKDPAAGYELWKTDGTAAGTVMVKDIYPGPSWSNPYAFLDVNGIVYFQATDGVRGSELWKSDGTAAGTVMVKDIRPGSASFSPYLLADIGGNTYFVSNQIDLQGRELWKTDGTEAGTVLVRDFRPGTGYAQGRANLNGILYFSADDGVYGRELWRTDGTAEGTFRVTDIRAGSLSSDPSYLTVFGGSLYFAASDGVLGLELWKSDGTAAGTVRLLDLRPGVNSSDPGGLTVWGDRLFFSANDGSRGYELWKTDGTAAGTVLVSDTWPGSGTGGGWDLTPMGDALFFVAASTYNNNELWKTDGTPLGTVLVKEIRTGAMDSNPHTLRVVGDQLFLSANDGPHGQEAWVSDGTTEGTILPKDVYPSPNSGSPSSLVALGPTLLFAASNGGTFGLNGTELWTSDGTEAGTAMVKDLAPGTESSMPSRLAAFGGRVYFNAKSTTSALELWRSDGTAAGTSVWNDAWPGGNSGDPDKLTVSGGFLYYTANNGPSGVELWKTDGITSGLVKDIRPWYGSAPHDLADLGGTLLFAANDGTTGDELWRSDGTAAGTTLVKEIVPGASGSGPTGLTDVNGTVFFSAAEAATGRELWRTDGTATGTVQVADINPGAGASSPANLTKVAGALFFAADDGGTGIELWKSDGTAAGTVLVADINPGAGASNPGNLRNVDGTLFFTANDGVNGLELWRSDGTAAGTVLVEDLAPGAASSSPLFLTDVNGTLLFQANNGVDGAELWSSDGTPTGTFLVQDIHAGAPSASPSSMTLVGERVFFAATDENGVELWALANQAPTANAGPDQTVEVGPAVTVDASSSSDPDGNPLLFEWRDAGGALVGRSPLLAVPLPVGVHTFNLTVRDGLGGRSDDAVTVTVQDSTAPSVALSTPAPGETLLTGVPYLIQWTALDGGTLESVEVSLSTDGGATFAPVPGCAVMPGRTVSCTWASPGPAATAGLLRVQASDAASNVGAATVPIALANPFVGVTAPNSAVTWAPGSAQAILWGHNLPAGASVEVHLSRDGGAAWEMLAASVPASSGAYAWVVTGPRTTSARVRVRWAGDLNVGDASDLDFTINGAPTANAGGPYAGVRGQLIVLDGTGSGDPDGDVLTYQWDFGDGTTDTAMSPSHAYSDLGSHTVTLVVSDGMASSAPATALVTIRNQGPVSNAGSDQLVELGSLVTLDGSASYDPDGDPLTYDWRDAAGTPVGDSSTTTLELGLGTHDITLSVLDNHGEASSDVTRVTVRDTTAPAVAVVAPQGVQWLTGMAAEIQWTASDVGGLAVFDVFFSADGGATLTPIPGCTGLGGSARTCPWLSPGPASTDARVQVVARDPSGNSAAAMAAFTIADPFILVTAPSGSENWGVGSSQNITWSHNLGSATTVRVEISRNGGSTWTVLAASAPNSGTFNWTVSGPTTGAARLRVLWNENPAVADASDASFQIATAFVRVTSPNTRVTWSIGTARTITWSHNLGAGGTVRLEISRNGGSSWSLLNASVPNDSASSGSHVWTVTGPGTSQARVRATWTANTAVTDRSDSNFVIR